MSAAQIVARYADRMIAERNAEIERLREGLRMLATQEYDTGYTPEGYAEAVLSGHEPSPVAEGERR